MVLSQFSIRLRFYLSRVVINDMMVDAITELAGGLTVYPASGVWLNPEDGKVYQDPEVVVIEVLVEDSEDTSLLSQIVTLVSDGTQGAGESALLYTQERVHTVAIMYPVREEA